MMHTPRPGLPCVALALLVAGCSEAPAAVPDAGSITDVRLASDAGSTPDAVTAIDRPPPADAGPFR